MSKTSLRRLCGALVAIASLTALPVASASAEEFSVKTLSFDTVTGPNDDIPCTIIGDLYKPASASKAKPAPAILTTNGFGGSKDGQAGFAKFYASRGYVVLSYSGLGFGGSDCKITLDDRDYDGKAGSQLVTFLGGGKAATDGTKIDYVQLDQKGSDGRARPNDPRLGMIGGSYGGQIQFAIAGIDARVDTIIPIITWNDLSYSLAPNNTTFYSGVSTEVPGVEKVGWSSLFFALGAVNGVSPGASSDPARNVGCPNFDDRACAAKLQMDLLGYPNDATTAFARHASVASFIDKIRIPTLLAQGEADTLFNLQEAVATYRSLKAQGTPVKMIWQSGGHSGGAAPGDADLTKPESNYEGRQFLDWFEYYLKGSKSKPSLDFTFFRDWVKYEGDATKAYGRAPAYPAGKPRELFLSGSNGLVDSARNVADGAASLLTPALGAPTSFTEVSAVDQSRPVMDVTGTVARFETQPLVQDTDVVGVPSVTVRVNAPAHALTGQAGAVAELVLFFKLYDLAPDGTITLSHRLISPARIAITDGPIDVELPGIAHRFPKGNRIALAVSGGDAAYRGNNIAAPVQLLTSASRPSVLKLPVASEGADYGAVVQAVAPVKMKKAKKCAPKGKSKKAKAKAKKCKAKAKKRARAKKRR